MVDKTKILGFKFFTGLSEEELDVVWALGRESVRTDGEKLIEEDNSTADACIFVILEGLVKINVEAARGDDNMKSHKRLAVLKTGNIFGEMGLLGANRRSAQVEVYSEKAKILAINQQELLDLFEQNTRIGFIMMRNLAIILSERLVELNFMWRDDIK